MDRSAKGIRIAGALLLFVNLAVFFLPMTKIVHTNYGTKEFSAFQYLQNVIHPDSANPHVFGVSVIDKYYWLFSYYFICDIYKRVSSSACCRNYWFSRERQANFIRDFLPCNCGGLHYAVFCD